MSAEVTPPVEINHIDELLENLRKFGALRDTSVDGRADTMLTRVMPSHPPNFAPPIYLTKLPSWVGESLAAQGIETLYAHQAEAIDRILVETTWCSRLPLPAARRCASTSHWF